VKIIRLIFQLIIEGKGLKYVIIINTTNNVIIATVPVGSYYTAFTQFITSVPIQPVLPVACGDNRYDEEKDFVGRKKDLPQNSNQLIKLKYT